MKIHQNTLIPFFTGLTFAGAFVAGKYTTLEMQPLTITLLRYVIALLFTALLLVHYKTKALKIDKRDILPLALMGLLGIVGYHFFFFTSLDYTPVANTAIINAFSPAVTGLLAAIFIKERLSGTNYIGLALALIGVLTLITKGKIGNLIGMNFNVGDLYMLCAVVCWAIYSLIAKNIMRKYSGFTATFYAFAFGVFWLVFMALPEGIGQQLQDISLRAILSLLYMGIFASCVGILLYNLSIKTFGPTKTSSLVYSQVPVYVAVLALIFFGESITVAMILSAMLIIVGLNLVLKEKASI